MGEIPQIKFGENLPTLDELNLKFWNWKTPVMVEYFPNQMIPLQVIPDDAANLKDVLFGLIDGSPVSIDLEWRPSFYHDSQKPKPIETLQFATSKGVVIITCTDKPNLQAIVEFFDQVELIGKGMSQDVHKLGSFLHKTYRFIDIETQLLTPHELSVNFNAIVDAFVGQPSAKFKDKRMTISDWSRRPLSIQQVLYGGFDALAMYRAFLRLVSQYGKPSINTADITERNETSLDFSNIKFLESSAFNGALSKFCDIKIHTALLEAIKSQAFQRIHTYSSANECWIHSFNEPYAKLFGLKENKGFTQLLAFLNGCFTLPNLQILRKGDIYTCKACGKTFEQLSTTLRHFGHLHMHGAEELPIQPKRALFMICVLKDVLELGTPIHCHECGKSFENEEAASDHCWEFHAEKLFSIIKTNEYVELKTEVEMNVIQQQFEFMKEGECSVCHSKFPDNSKLFAHWVGSHTRPFLVSSKDFSRWVLKANIAFKSKKIEGFSFESMPSLITALADGFECNDCKCIVPNLKKVVSHLLQNHCVCIPDDLAERVAPTKATPAKEN